jgi:erythromycin esterase-like protein
MPVRHRVPPEQAKIESKIMPLCTKIGIGQNSWRHRRVRPLVKWLAGHGASDTLA